MEEKLSDKICEETFQEFYINKDYNKSIKMAKKTYRLLARNDIKDYKDNFYMWMILMIIIQSYDKLDKIENAYMYIHLSTKYVTMDYMKFESLYYLIKYYIKVEDNTKVEFYLWKCIKSCDKIREYNILSRIIDL